MEVSSDAVIERRSALVTVVMLPWFHIQFQSSQYVAFACCSFVWSYLCLTGARGSDMFLHFLPYHTKMRAS